MTRNYYIIPPQFEGDYCQLCYRAGYHTYVVRNCATMKEAIEARAAYQLCE